MPVDELDIGTLGSYLQENVEGFSGLKVAEKFSDGQSNPTFLLTADSGRYVLRKQPPGVLLKSAHAVDREFRVIKALADSNVPVATVYHLCEDPDLINGMFYVMSFEDGRVFWDPALPQLDSEERGTVYDEMNRVLAALHDVDVEAAGLIDFGYPGNYFERQVGRWSKQYRASETETIAAMDSLIDWLPANMPEYDGKAGLIHGDYRLDNIMFHKTELRAQAVLDWELSTLGHPYADLAYQCMQLRVPRDAVVGGLGGIDRTALGIPTEEEYVGLYCKRRGLEGIPNWDFYLVFSFFRLAAILQGVLRRAIDGNASSKKALLYGGLAPKLADLAMDIVEKN